MSIHAVSKSAAPEAIVSFDRFLEETGLSSTTGWRYRNKGWLQCLNIAGRWYVKRSEIERFIARASAGEFAKKPSRPQRMNKAAE